MKYIKITILSFFCFLPFLSFAQINVSEPQDSAYSFDGNALLQYIKTLSSDTFEGRRTGTKGAEKTQNYIIHQFDSLNVLPLGKHYKQSFTFTEKRQAYQGINILGYIKGAEFPEKYIVLSAHYDHEGVKDGDTYNGADDNASGTSALFSFAEYFKNHPPKHSVILAAFDAEELGLQGAKYFVENPIIPLEDVIVNFNMDMISRNDKNELFAVGARFNNALQQIVLNTPTPKNIKLRTGHDGADGQENWTYSSDHAAFHRKNIPFLYFGVEDHEDYHQPTDDYENIQPQFYINAVKTIISVFKQVDTLSL
tara:strand:- start:14002 stop:14931 length:930 start_codon:yes stop_codon:yes gene_type:complete